MNTDHDFTTRILTRSELPAPVAAIVKQACGRKHIEQVEVRFTTYAAALSNGWHSPEGVSCGSVLCGEQHHWAGSDGESNVTVTEWFSGPTAAFAWKGRATVVIGNLPGAMVEAIRNARAFDLSDLTAAAWDASLDAEPSLPAEVETKVTFRNLQGDSGCSSVVRVPRAEYDCNVVRLASSNGPARTVASKRGAKLVKLSKGNSTHALARIEARNGTTPVATDSHADAMLAAGWLS